MATEELAAAKDILRHMKLRLSFATLTVLLPLLLGGCGESAPKLQKADLAAFDSAPPAVRQDWQKALSAAKTNNHLLAITTLRSLLQGELSVEQIEAVQNALRVSNMAVVQSADRGDAEAGKTLDALKGGAERRSR